MNLQGLVRFKGQLNPELLAQGDRSGCERLGYDLRKEIKRSWTVSRA